MTIAVDTRWILFIVICSFASTTHLFTYIYIYIYIYILLINFFPKGCKGRCLYIYIYIYMKKLTIEANLYSTINKVKVAGFFSYQKLIWHFA